MKLSLTTLASASAFLLLTVSAHAQKAPALKVGDTAPEIKVGKWIQGDPVTQLGKGKVTIVEFWATWCGPCRESIPHLTEMSKKFAGKATFVGVSVYESHGGPFAADTYEKVGKFVTQMGEKMTYTVAADGESAFMGKNWMEAAGQGGIPTAFVVGKDGKIAWIGHPSGLEEVVGKVVEGKFDVAAAKKQAQKEKDDEAKNQKLMAAFNKAMSESRFKDAVAALDPIAKAMPKQKLSIEVTKYQLMLRYDEKGAYNLAKSLLDGEAKEDAQALNTIAWAIVDDNAKLKKPDYKLALQVALQAVKASKEQDGSIMDTLAAAYFKTGDKAKAAATEKKAITLAENDKNSPEELVKQLKDQLAKYEK